MTKYWRFGACAALGRHARLLPDPDRSLARTASLTRAMVDSGGRDRLTGGRVAGDTDPLNGAARANFEKPAYEERRRTRSLAGG